MAKAGSLAIGIDIGGTKTAIGLVDPSNGVVLARRELETEASNGADALHARLGGVVAEVAAGHGGIPRVGVAVPELVSPTDGVVTDVVIPGLAGDLVERWADLGVTAVESDVRAAAIAESRFGHGLVLDPFAFVSVGTGVSCCFVRGGAPWTGVHGAAILLGSGIVVEGNAVGSPSLEAIAGGPGLVARFTTLGGRATTAQEVTAMAERDAIARQAVVETGAVLGAGIAQLVNLLDPAGVIVGGGLGSAPGLYWDAAVAEARVRIWADIARDVPILQSRLGRDAALIGAAVGS